MAIGKEFLELQEVIDYSFRDITYLQNALTHSSYSYEMKNRGINAASNERLEFLGDAVLQIIISKYLYNNFKNQNEGVLTKMRQQLVCERTLSRIASEISLGDYINVGRGEEMTDCRARPKVLADALEAVIAAVYLDAGDDGIASAERSVLRLFSNEIKSTAEMRKSDYKTMLQEVIEKDGSAVLEYAVVATEGPEHNKTFTVEARVDNNVVGRASAGSKKEAEMRAAHLALQLFGVEI